MPDTSIKSLRSSEEVLRSLQDRILDGEYKVGSRLPTERELAAEFGIGRSMARDVILRLSEQGLVERKPGFRPRITQPVSPKFGNGSQGAVENSTGIVAAILPNNPAFPAASELLKGIQYGLRQYDTHYKVVVIDTHGETWHQTCKWEADALEYLDNNDVAGAIVWQVATSESLPKLSALAAKNFPLVFVDRFPQGWNCDFVGVDNKASAREATDYLLRLGHTRIAHLTNTENITAVWEREAGYREALVAHGVQVCDDLVYRIPVDDEYDTKRALDYFMSMADPPTAVFSVNDYTAYSFINNAEECGLSVPGDISVVGFDDLERNSPRPGMLTTVHQPFRQMGERATNLMLRRLDATQEVTPPQHYILSSPFVVRSSCRKLSK